MIILGIDTSCDETSVAVLRAKKAKSGSIPEFKILSNIISSQIKIHSPFGGVVPHLAARAHHRNLPFCVKKAFERAKIKPSKVDLIAVTVGPGLEPCLWAGIEIAKLLGFVLDKPLVPVNHIEGHIAANWLKPIGGISNFQFPISKNIFPAMALVVSGGHTQLLLMEKFRRYKIVGETRDDAAGEAFDKVAKLLGLGYPGGPAIARLAEQWKSQIPNYKFQTPKENLRFPTGQANSTPYQVRGKIPNSKFILPRPMLNSKDYDFSFSGLKTAVLYLVKSLQQKKQSLKDLIPAIAYEFQQAVIDILILKTIKAAREYKVKTILLGGGVAANQELRKQFYQKLKKEKLSPKFKSCPVGLSFGVPSSKFCTDNGAMIAAAGFLNQKKKTKNFEEIKANSNLTLDIRN